jgi:IQ motif and SEC7 domain-containing protein
MSANRAVSFRERRNVLDSNFNQVATPAVKRQPLSQNNFQQLPSQPNPQHSHAYVNLLHQQDQQYNNYQNYHAHSNINNNNNFAISSTNSSLNSSALHHFDVSQLNTSSGSSNVNSSMNSSWNSYSNSPNASLYAQQQQYYIRPRASSVSKKVPPEVPKRTSSIQNTPPKYQQSHMHHHNKHHHHHHHPQQQVQFVQGKPCGAQFYKTENGNHSSPSSADSLSLSSNSPIPSHWQQQTSIEQQQILHQQYLLEQKQLQQQLIIQKQNEIQLQAKLSETIRKRQYRIGLNLFNKKPEKGITYLMHKNFLENSPHAVAKFLISRKGLSRQMIGEYLGNLQQSFNMAVLEYFAEEMDFSGLAVDIALKKFQGYFRMPGEAQKIERLMEVFSHRYGVCNPDVIEKLRSPDTVTCEWTTQVLRVLTFSSDRFSCWPLQSSC